MFRPTALAARRGATVSTAMAACSAGEVVPDGVLAALASFPNTNVTAAVIVVTTPEHIAVPVFARHMSGFRKARWGGNSLVGVRCLALHRGAQAGQSTVVITPSARCTVRDWIPLLKWDMFRPTALAARRGATVSTAMAACSAGEVVPDGVLAALASFPNTNVTAAIIVVTTPEHIVVPVFARYMFAASGFRKACWGGNNCLVDV